MLTQESTATNHSATRPLRILVVIANYGSTNDKYLSQVIDEYRSMPYSTDVVVVSNLVKKLGPEIEVRVGLPTRDPWSLPFAHKQIFADRKDAYDLFIYSEDDILLTQQNIEAFLRASAVLPGDEIAGFFRFERDSTGNIFYPDVHWNYHWDSRSIRLRDGLTFAFFTNEHAGCYAMTQAQLHRAIHSGGFLVAPHRGRYGLPETAATDPYTQCGFTKLICISEFKNFVVHHLSNRYAGRIGLDAANLQHQIRALLQMAAEGLTTPPLVELKALHFRNNYYEPARNDVVRLIPESATHVLSIGCGWGATEEALEQHGKKVVAVPLEPVISACAEARGVTVLKGDLNTVFSRLSGQKFDCVVISNLLHAVYDPGAMLAELTPLLSGDAMVVTTVPNLTRIPVLTRKLRRVESHRYLGDFAKSGLHLTSRRVLRSWLGRGGFRVDRFIDILPKRAEKICRRTGGLVNPLVSSEIIAVAVKA